MREQNRIDFKAFFFFTVRVASDLPVPGELINPAFSIDKDSSRTNCCLTCSS